jgi:nucleoside-diphosphate-sugar epimerase
VKIFLAGATGVLGIRTVQRLVAAGHQVTGIARTPDKASALEGLGATPATVELFDAAGVTAAVAGHEVVMNLATHIPDLSKAARPGAWKENDRIRTEGSRILVDAAIAAKASRYVQESIGFFYADGGADWLDEDSVMDAPAFAASFQAAEAQAARFAESGGSGVALRFSMFYGAGTAHTETQLKGARFGVSPFPGPKDSYQSFIHIDDAAAAAAAALTVPSGIYNVAEDHPATRAELAAVVAAALGKKKPGRAIPGVVKIGGEKTAYLGRSVRVSNRRFKDASGWAPAYPTPADGWRQVVAEAAASR